MGRRRNSALAPAAAAEPPRDLAAELLELGLKAGDDGLVVVEMLKGASCDDFSVETGARHRCDPELAIRMVKRGEAQPVHRRR